MKVRRSTISALTVALALGCQGSADSGTASEVHAPGAAARDAGSAAASGNSASGGSPAAGGSTGVRGDRGRGGDTDASNAGGAGGGNPGGMGGNDAGGIAGSNAGGDAHRGKGGASATGGGICPDTPPPPSGYSTCRSQSDCTGNELCSLAPAFTACVFCGTGGCTKDTDCRADQVCGPSCFCPAP